MKRIERNLLNADFVEFLQCLDSAGVASIVVGGYAVVLHGYFRTTGDLDVWVQPTVDNFQKLLSAFREFGLPTEAISEEAFLDLEGDDVFTFGRPPVAIDLLTKVKGLDFDDTFNLAKLIEVDGAPMRLIHLNHLREAKIAAGRHKDLDDLENLKKDTGIF